MRSAPSVIVFAGTLAAAGALGLATGMAAQLEEIEVRTHRSQGEVKPVDGAKGRLLRTTDGIFVNLETKGLTPGNAYTLLLAVMNDPAACKASPCEPSDVLKRTTKTRADIGYADGFIAGEDGTARFAAFQPVGELRSAWFGNGLKNPEGAEVHLIVNDHGPFLPELGATMVTTYRGGCADKSIPAAFPDSAKADGKAGPNTCRLLQTAVFVPASM
jgi:hypothetical protein